MSKYNSTGNGLLFSSLSQSSIAVQQVSPGTFVHEKPKSTTVDIMARAVKDEAQDLPIVAGVSRPSSGLRPGCGPCMVVEFGLPETGAWDLRAIALHLQNTLGSSHSSATLAGTTPAGETIIYRWVSGMSEPAGPYRDTSVPVPWTIITDVFHVCKPRPSDVHYRIFNPTTVPRSQSLDHSPTHVYSDSGVHAAGSDTVEAVDPPQVGLCISGSYISGASSCRS